MRWVRSRKGKVGVLVVLAGAVAVACAPRRIDYAIEREALPDTLPRYYEATARLTEAAPVGSFVHAGHRFGAYQDYPTNLHRVGAEQPLDVGPLMDLCFGPLGLNGAEFDVRPSPLPGDGRVLVVHDRIGDAPLDAAALDYLARNTLDDAFLHFAGQGYHRRGCRLFVELKGSGAEIEGTVEALLALDETLGPEEAAQVRLAIDVLSFQREALTRTHEAWLARAGDRAQPRLFFIPTSNRFPVWLHRKLTSLPVFDEAAHALLHEPWVSGVFFDPRFMNDFAALFNGISREREAVGLAPLEVHLSGFLTGFEDFAELLEEQDEPLLHVRGIVYEVKK
jgi:hypothetical protein